MDGLGTNVDLVCLGDSSANQGRGEVYSSRDWLTKMRLIPCVSIVFGDAMRKANWRY